MHQEVAADALCEEDSCFYLQHVLLSHMEAHVSAYVHRYLHIEHINSFEGTDIKWEPSVFGMLKRTHCSAQEDLVWDVFVSRVALLDDTEQHTSISTRRTVAGLQCP